MSIKTALARTVCVHVFTTHFTSNLVKMKSSNRLAGACLLTLVFIIAECKLTLDIKRQEENPCEISNDLGICLQAVLDEDVATLCDNDCADILEDYAECGELDYDSEIDQLREECGGAGVGAALLSIMSAVVVALAANLN